MIFIKMLLLGSIFSLQAQVMELGKYTYGTFENGLLKLVYERGFAEVSIVKPSIIHVRVSTEPITENFSYAVIYNEVNSDAIFAESQTEWKIIDENVTINISKSSFGISCFDKNNQVIYENHPDFGISKHGPELTCYNRLFPDERFIGLGEKTGNLDRRGSGYTNWNTDCFGYTPETDPMYVSIPFYIGLHSGLCYGVFLDNSSKSHFNFGASNTRFSSFSVENGELDYYIFPGENVPELLWKYTHLTGRTPMPARWSLGFQQCRWSYYPDSEVMNLARTFREKSIPLDVVYLDIHYMDQYKVFTWDKERFSNPTQMVNDLKSMGIKTTLIVDPGVKVEKNYSSYESGLKGDYFLKYPDQSQVEASVWPGLCHFPDFTSPATRQWWGEQFKGYVENGVMGFWNDMNEPATWGQRFPSNVIFNFDGHPTTTIDGRNVYGMQMARATYEGTAALMGNRRPLVLTRAGFAGIQRYSAIWTGDNTATDEHLLLGVRLLNSLGVSGVANCGVDVGGFTGDGTPQLYARWITIGAFTPFFRAHKMINMRRAEPWSYGEEVEVIAKRYIQWRYRLMPYIYSVFFESNTTGVPVVRTLAIDHPFDENVYSPAFQNQFMLGESMLIAPLKSTETAVNVYLPKGTWFDVYNDRTWEGGKATMVEAPLYRLPVFVKASAIIPQQSQTFSLSEQSSDTLFVHVYYGSEENTFVMYDDDGETIQPTSWKMQTIRFSPKDESITIEKQQGEFKSHYKEVTFILRGFDVTKKYSLNGIAVRVKEVSEFPVFELEDYNNSLYYAQRDTVKTLQFTAKLEDKDVVLNWK